MGILNFTATMSLDGYVADASGDFQWSAPSEDVLAFHHDRMSVVSTEVLGRKTYGLMTYWDADPDDGSWGPAEQEFAQRWRGIDKVVVSSTLTQGDLTSDNARLVADLGLGELEQIVRSADGEVEIFGPTTASTAIRAELVQQFRFFIAPKVIGGGLPALPSDAQLDLQLVENRTFSDGTQYLQYRKR